MRRWNHAHSLLVGGSGGLAVAQHAWLVFLIGVAAGLVLAYAGRAVGWVRRMGGHAERRLALEAHPCVQCAAPIDGRSRRQYCSESCRVVAREMRQRRDRLEAKLEQAGDIPWT